MSDPWSHDLHRLLTQTRIAPEPLTPDVDEPWGVELANGQRCRFATGAHDSVGDDVVDYYCDEQSLGLGLLRGLDKTKPVWTARAARYIDNHYERSDAQDIATAWFSP